MSADRLADQPSFDPGHAPYATGVQCTWHNFVDRADRAYTSKSSGSVPVCPNCLGELRETTYEEFQAEVRSGERRLPGYDGMMLWSRGRCFPDFDILENAYRQAMEE